MDISQILPIITFIGTFLAMIVMGVVWALAPRIIGLK